MLRNFTGVVSSLLLIILLGIGATPAEAVNASKQILTVKPGEGILCEKSNVLCSIGNVSPTNIFPKNIALNLPLIADYGQLASNMDSLDPQIDSTNIKADKMCSINSAKEDIVKEDEAVIPTLSYFVTPVLEHNKSESATIISITPTPDAQVAVESSLNADTLFGLVNSKRVEAGLAPLEKNPAVCSVADARAPEMQSDVQSGYMHRGFYNRKPDYQSTENIIYMQSEQQALNWWLNSPVHRSAIFGAYKQSCIVCQGNTCAQIFANLPEKTAVALSP